VIDAAVFRRVALFSELEAGELEALARAFSPRSYPSGSPIIRESEPGDLFFVILRGEVKVFVDSPDGREVIARGPDGHYQRYALDGGSAAPVPGLQSADIIVSFRPDGRSMLVYQPWEMPGRVESVDLTTGQRTLVRELARAE